ncbi:MAG: hypothetical protein WC784_00230 [Candidatus Shapirobacteria bacterium]|jgi:hypothetical protein
MKKYLGLILISVLILSACGKNTPTATTSPTPTPRLVEMAVADRPTISLLSRNDGHELTLRIGSISKNITKIEYELTYTAATNGLEIEKGASGNIEATDLAATKTDRKILLGTESCTSGCKYSYDNGVTGGNLNLTFTTQNGQISTFDTPFTLKSSAEVKKAGKLVWTDQNFSSVPKSIPSSTYFVVLKDYKNDGSYLVTNSSSL